MPTSTLEYITLLEKTNQQLSLWYNPYALIVGILTLIVALLAISFAYILWKQSRDYKDFLEDQKKVLRNEVKIFASSVLDEHIQSKNKEYEQLTGNARNKLEAEIKALQDVRNSLFHYSRTPAVSSSHFDSSVPNGFNTPTRGLTENQILSIISLLQSFSADQWVIDSVEKTLRAKG